MEHGYCHVNLTTVIEDCCVMVAAFMFTHSLFLFGQDLLTLSMEHSLCKKPTYFELFKKVPRIL